MNGVRVYWYSCETKRVIFSLSGFLIKHINVNVNNTHVDMTIVQIKGIFTEIGKACQISNGY